MPLYHLTNDELIAQLTLRDDLTELEQHLLDRLIQAVDVIKELEDELPACGPQPTEGVADGSNT